MWDSLWVDVRAATFAAGDGDYGLIDDAAIATSGESIAWIGPRSALPASHGPVAKRTVSGGGRCMTPGLVDCHTHLVFGGDRARDLELRIGGATYAEIAAAGGGIRSTVEHTRRASVDELVAVTLPRARLMLAGGTTTLEIKSGYGLDVEAELRMLRAARRVGELLDVQVVTTLLALHALPAEFTDNRASFVSRVCEELIPAAAAQGLADAVDVFCESIAFSVAECEQAMDAARLRGLPVKVHADQLSNGGGAALAARHRALSADHVEYTDEAGVAALAASGTTAVLLPGAFLILGEKQRPPVARFRAHGVPMALATDCNPGTSPLTSPELVPPLACALFALTPAEAVAGVTREAARALGLLSSRGTLEVGKRADFVLWDVAHPRELAYWLGSGRVHSVVRGGRTRPPASVPG